jgi:CDP-diacylglycerol--serine O-phosphatidyltransferase
VVGLLMVSPIPYRSFKDVQLHGSFGTLVLSVLALVVLLTKPSVTFFLVGVAYVASGPIEAYWRRRTGRPLTELRREEDAAKAPPGAPGAQPHE